MKFLKNKNMIAAILLTVLTTVLIALAQVLWKIGLDKIGGFYLPESSIFENIVRVAFSVYIISGILLYVIATVIFLFLLNKYPISLIVPLSSISFIFTMIAGIVIFKEQVNYINWIGAIVILIGVFLITKK
jgi:drug/metabolite transporter (DMT)-like permease